MFIMSKFIKLIELTLMHNIKYKHQKWSSIITMMIMRINYVTMNLSYLNVIINSDYMIK